jgi:hypothetical protein
LIDYLLSLYMTQRTTFHENLTEREYFLESVELNSDLLWDKGIQLVPVLESSKLAFKLADGRKIWQLHSQFFLENINDVVEWLPDGYEHLVA